MNVADYTPADDSERAIWRHLNSHDRVTHADLKKATDVSDWKRTNFLSKLKRLGILKDCDRDGPRRVFTIMDQQAAQAFAQKRRNTPQGAMWTTMRVLRTFTPVDLQITLTADRPEITLDEIEAYCRLLRKAEYLVVLQKAKAGVSPARYRLARDTGPLPVIQRTLPVIIDTNDDSVAYVSGARK